MNYINSYYSKIAAVSNSNSDFILTSQIIFIDSQVEDYQTLAEGVKSGIEIAILDRDRNGIAQITEILNQRSNIATVHIVSHGSPGCLYFGNSKLSLNTLKQYQSELKTWFSNSPLLLGEGLGERLLIYGCNVAAGDAGEEFITKLHNITGAEIAASSTLIGNAAKGGNWELDLSTDSQNVPLAFSQQTQKNYLGVLTEIFNDDFDGNSSGGTGNWTVNPNGTDTATTNDNGQWIIAPITEDLFDTGTTPIQLNPYSSPNALITGHSTTDDQFTFVGGVTTIHSPRFILNAPVEEADFINLSLQYYAIASQPSANDKISIDLVDSSDDTVISTLFEQSFSGGQFPTSWASFSTYLDPSLVGREVYLRFTADDSDAGSLVDFAVDNISVTSGETASLPWEPNPQNGGILTRGTAFISCGTLVNSLADAVIAVERIDIDANGNPVVPTSGEETVVSPVRWMHRDWTQDKLGNVFGLDIDLQGNMYAAASSNYSSGFLGQNANINYGSIGSTGGGTAAEQELRAAGTVYKMDAVTGAPAVFVQLPQTTTAFTHIDTETSGNPIARNTGVGLGNIHHDKVHDQFFVSNFEDGRIYRVDKDGNILDSYDPGALFVNNNDTSRIDIDETVYGLTINPDGSELFFGQNRTVYSIPLDSDGSFQGGTVSGSESYLGQNWDNYQNAPLTTHTTIPDVSDVNFGFGNIPLDVIISDLDFLPTGELLIGSRAYRAGNLSTSYNHGGHNFIVTDNGSGEYPDANRTEFLGFSTNTANTGGDDGYGGVAYAKNVDPDNDGFNYVFSSADIIEEAGPHGITVFPDEYTTDGATGEIVPRAAIDYGGGGNDPKGVGGDVDVFNPGSIQGNVSQDTTGDGNGDSDLSGVTLGLFDATGTNSINDFEGNPITATTDANGDYIFDNIFPGDYTVIESQPLGLESLSENEGGTDDDHLPSGNTDVNDRIFVRVSVEENDIGNDFVEAQLYKISGTVLSDTQDEALNAIDNPGDTPIQGVTISLYADSNGDGIPDVDGLGETLPPIDTKITGTDGSYEFPNLVDGNYVVVETQPTGFVSVTNKDDNTENKIPATIAGADSVDNDFLEQPPENNYSLGNRIWQDTNNNGDIDGTEAGIDGVVVNLYQDSDNDGTPDGAAISTETTDNGGYYRFDDLAADNYIVEVAGSNFDSGNALEGLSSSSVDEAEPDDDGESNDNGIGTTPDAIDGIRSGTITLGANYSEPTGETDIDPTFPTEITTTQTDSNDADATSVIRINAIDGANRGRFINNNNFANRFVVDVPGYGDNFTGFCIEFAEFVQADRTYTPVNAVNAGPFFNSSHNDPTEIIGNKLRKLEKSQVKNIRRVKLIENKQLKDFISQWARVKD